MERFFRPTYQAHLTTEWIPALDGIHERLQAGGLVADVGCGHGASSLLVAAAYPQADPRGAAVHARQALADGGAVLLVEPFAHDRLEDNLNPVGRVYYAASTVFCSLNDDGAALGAQAGEQRLRSIFTDAGFSSFRRVAETPFNLVLEARL